MGKYDKSGRFISNIEKNAYDTIMNSDLIQKSKEQEITVTLSHTANNGANHRRITLLDENLESKSKKTSIKDTDYQEKQNIKKINLKNLSTRVSLSSEKPINKEEFSEKTSNYMKIRYRYSKISKNGHWRYDFGKVYEFDGYDIKDKTLIKNWLNEIKKENMTPSYELEIEYIGKHKKSDTIFNALNEELKNVYKLLNIKTESDINIIDEIINSFTKDNYIKQWNKMKLEKMELSQLDFNRLVQNVKPLSLSNINIIEKNQYSVTLKADGVRALYYISKKGETYILNNQLQKTKCDLYLNSKNIKLGGTLLDGELIENTFYIFDILLYQGNDVTQDYFTKRHEYFRNISNDNFTKSQNDKNFELNIKSKKFYLDSKDIGFDKKFKNIFMACNDLLENHNENEFTIDGLIFQPLNTGYRGKSEKGLINYKWKTALETTIDFLVKINDIKNTMNLELYVGVSR